MNEERLHARALELQAGGPDEFPNGYFLYLAELEASVLSAEQVLAEEEEEENYSLPENRPCGICGRNPAAGLATYWTKETGEIWYCHGDEDEDQTSCYERANWIRSELL